jgi:hypothetical protein
MEGERAQEMVADPASPSRGRARQYITEFVTRFRTHPAILFYELTNEMNLLVDIDFTAQGLGCMTTSQLIAFSEHLVSAIRAADPDHAISSGYSLSRKAAEHLRRQPGCGGQPLDWTEDSFAEFSTNLADLHGPFDIISAHFYNNVERDNERFGHQGAENADLLQDIKAAADALGKPLFVGEFGDRAAVPLSTHDGQGTFLHRVFDQIAQLRIPYSAVWVWEFYPRSTMYDSSTGGGYSLEPGFTDLTISELRATNESFGALPPDSGLSDGTPPYVILTWPLSGASLATDQQQVHAVASDIHNGTPQAVRVEVYLDEEQQPRAILTAPPYECLLYRSELSEGTHTIRARALDPSGNAASHSIVLVRPLSSGSTAQVSASGGVSP